MSKLLLVRFATKKSDFVASTSLDASRSQVPVDGGHGEAHAGDPACVPLPIHTFCSQISSDEFEQQKLAASQKAMEELLEMLLTDQNISEKERHKKLKQVGGNGFISIKKNKKH